MTGPAKLTCRAGTARAGNSRAGVYLGEEEGMRTFHEEGDQKANPWVRVAASPAITWTEVTS